MKKPIEPKDLGLKIGTPEEVFWTKIKNEMETGNRDARHMIEMNEHMLIYAEDRIREEKEKFK